MTAQKIYGRFAYPLGTTTSTELFNFYKDNKILSKTGIQVGGISASRDVTHNIAILLTYDEDSELMLRLKFYGNPSVVHKELIPIIEK